MIDRISRRSTKRRRRGMALAMVLILSVAAMSMVASLVHMTLARQRQMRSIHHRCQATWLVEAGLDRGIARLQADSEYGGEDWFIPADQLGGTYAARVAISVTSELPTQREENPQDHDDLRVYRLRAQVDYPADVTTRIRRQKSISVTRSPVEQ